MLKKADAQLAEGTSSAPGKAGATTAKRTWASMRARLRQNRQLDAAKPNGADDAPETSETPRFGRNLAPKLVHGSGASDAGDTASGTPTATAEPSDAASDAAPRRKRRTFGRNAAPGDDGDAPASVTNDTSGTPSEQPSPEVSPPDDPAVGSEAMHAEADPGDVDSGDAASSVEPEPTPAVTEDTSQRAPDPEPVEAGPSVAPTEPAAPDAPGEPAAAAKAAEENAASAPAAVSTPVEAPASIAATADPIEPEGSSELESEGLSGHVISVSGSIVWTVLHPGTSNSVEIGDVVRLQSKSGRSFGVITTLKADGRRSADDDRRLAEIKLLGEIREGSERFQRGVSSHPALDSAVQGANRDELETIFGRPDAPTVRLGTLHQAADLPAFAITDNLLGKHFAVLGTTGAGKSCAVTVILRAILDANPFGHVIMLDPHNEYGQAFGDRAERLDPTNLKLPYWLLNFEEISEVLVTKDSAERSYAESAILRSAILEAKRASLGPDADTDHVTVDTPYPYRLSELVRIIKDAMGAFNKAENSAPYQHLISKIESVMTDKRYDFMFSSFMVQDNMSQVLSRILRIPVEDKPITIIDISGMPSEVVDVVVSVLCRVIFEFALWSDREKAPPLLLVCEESHRYVPRDEAGGFAPTKRAISRIAKEGRKYGLSLCLVTQRPAELSTSSLSQCNTIFALRMGNEHDLKIIRHAIPDSAGWLTDAMPALNTREAVVIGDGVPVPMHIRFEELAEHHRPASTTPPFSHAWQSDVEDQELIPDTIERWRRQIRGGQQAS